MTDELRLAPTPKRRAAFVCAGLVFLGLGVGINGDRLGLVEDESVADDRVPPETYDGAVASTDPPPHAIPQMARNFDPEAMDPEADLLRMLQGKGGHFIASPYGGAFAVGDDNDVWGGLTGTEIGEAFGVGGLGLVGTGRGGGGGGTGYGGRGLVGGGRGYGGRGRGTVTSERYAHVEPNPRVIAQHDATSTFSIDVDTASYSNTRRWVMQNAKLPPLDAVRTEELVNYFDYDYPQPEGDAPFSVTTEVGPSPWDPERRLVHIGLQGKTLGGASVPPRNLVFLVDVSGSMGSPEKLPLVKLGLAALTEQLGANDWISIVVYAGAAGAVLSPTRGDQQAAIVDALKRLESGGSTNGADGIRLAYALARKHFIRGGVNRVILATDGDFNVGVSSVEGLIATIEKQRRTGVFLSVLGFGAENLDDAMMEGIADHGNGNYAYIDGPSEVRKVLVEEAGAMLDAIAKDVKVQIKFDRAQVREHRLIGYENRKLAHRDFDDDQKDAGEIGAGHAVTALYEILPTRTAGAVPLARLALRYKLPDGDSSRELAFDVGDDGRTLAGTSDDFRFASAVAVFAQELRRSSEAAKTTYADVLELAEGAVGDDPQCYRRKFLDLVWTAGRLASEEIAEPPTHACTAVAAVPEQPEAPVVEPRTPSPEPAEPSPAPPPTRDEDGMLVFVLEVLRLLPPLIALPMFVLAFRNRRRPIA